MKTITVDLVKEFTSCILESRPDDLYDLLAPDGEFNAQDAERNNTEVNRDGFISWIKSRLAEESVTAYYYDQCTFCSIGSPVVLFNDGSFPRQIQDDSESIKTRWEIKVQYKIFNSPTTQNPETDQSIDHNVHIALHLPS